MTLQETRKQLDTSSSKAIEANYPCWERDALLASYPFHPLARRVNAKGVSNGRGQKPSILQLYFVLRKGTICLRLQFYNFGPLLVNRKASLGVSLKGALATKIAAFNTLNRRNRQGRVLDAECLGRALVLITATGFDSNPTV